MIVIDRLQRVREGATAPEELEFIAHSLALDLLAGRGTLLMFADSADEKELLLAALRARTG